MVFETRYYGESLGIQEKEQRLESDLDTEFQIYYK